MLLALAPITAYAESENSITCDKINIAGGWWQDKAIHQYYENTASGASINIINKINKKIAPLNILEPVTFARELSLLEQGKLDIIVGLFDVPERQKMFTLSVPFYLEDLYVYAEKSTLERIKSPSDLVNFVGGVNRKSSYGQKIDMLIKTKKAMVVEVKDITAVSKLLDMKRIDYYIGSKSNTDWLTTKTKRAKTPIAQQKIVVAMSKMSPCLHLMPQINNLANEMLAASSQAPISSQNH